MTKRITGRKLQQRRLRMWSANPHCSKCGRLVAYPHGFELDHIEPLKADGGKGEDTEDNCQILCNGRDGCHEAKTRQDMGFRERTRFDKTGRVVW